VEIAVFTITSIMIISIIMIINNNNYYNSNNNDNILCFFYRFCTQKFAHRLRHSTFPATSLNQLPATFHRDVRFAVPKEMQFEILGAAGWEWSGWSHHGVVTVGTSEIPLAVELSQYIIYYLISTGPIEPHAEDLRHDENPEFELEHICHIWNEFLGNPLSWRPIQVPTSSKKYP
jgi:hypothetical protein